MFLSWVCLHLKCFENLALEPEKIWTFRLHKFDDLKMPKFETLLNLDIN